MTRLEKLAFPLIFIVSLIAYSMSHVMMDSDFASHWMIREDGFLESGTFLGLMAAAILCLYRATSLRTERPKIFIASLVMMAVVLAFGAGEEISWGQRILGIESPEFFGTHNAQGETNLHNMVIGETKINKLVFGKILAAGLIMYLIPLGILYRRSPQWQNLVNRFAIPMPRVHHVIAILAVVALVETSSASKRGEINEFAISLTVFLMLTNPYNRHIYRKEANDSATQRSDADLTGKVQSRELQDIAPAKRRAA